MSSCVHYYILKADNYSFASEFLSFYDLFMILFLSLYYIDCHLIFYLFIKHELTNTSLMLITNRWWNGGTNLLRRECQLQLCTPHHLLLLHQRWRKFSVYLGLPCSMCAHMYIPVYGAQYYQIEVHGKRGKM